MAVDNGFVNFLPEDLGSTNRIFRIKILSLLKSNPPNPARSSIQQ
jgi:hypothetical protein